METSRSPDVLAVWEATPETQGEAGQWEEGRS